MSLWTSSTSSSTTFRSSQGSLPLPSEEGEEGKGAVLSSREVIDLSAGDDGKDGSGAHDNVGGAEVQREWPCPRCTLLNSPGDGACIACGFWNVAGVEAGGGTTGGGDGVRAADPTHSERLLDNDDDFGGTLAPLPEPITLNDYIEPSAPPSPSTRPTLTGTGSSDSDDDI